MGANGRRQIVDAEREPDSMKPYRNIHYRNAGKGEPCSFGCGRPTTDAAHIRLAGFCGTGQKPSDVMLVDACRTCHERIGNMNKESDAAEVLRALCRTLVRRAEMGWFDA